MRRDLYCARRRMVEDAGIEPAYVLFPKQETLLESDPRIRLEIFTRAFYMSKSCQQVSTFVTGGFRRFRTFASTGKNRLLCQLSYEPKLMLRKNWSESWELHPDPLLGTQASCCWTTSASGDPGRIRTCTLELRTLALVCLSFEISQRTCPSGAPGRI